MSENQLSEQNQAGAEAELRQQVMKANSSMKVQSFGSSDSFLQAMSTIYAPTDVTEEARRARVQAINENPNGREALEDRYGQVWDTQQLQQDFTVVGFMAPYCRVQRKSDDKIGLIEFQHDPRFYYNFS